VCRLRFTPPADLVSPYSMRGADLGRGVGPRAHFEQARAGFVTEPAGLGADGAMLMHLGVPQAFGLAGRASQLAGPQLRAQKFLAGKADTGEQAARDDANLG